MALGGDFLKFTMSVMIFFCLSANALEVERIAFADTLDVAGQKLVLNGAGLRTKRKLMMDFRVYVGALYLPHKSSDAKALIESDETKYLRMVFLRSLDKATIFGAVEEGMTKNCKFECESMKKLLVEYEKAISDVKEHDELNITFEKTSVTIEAKGKESRFTTITSVAFRKNLLNIYLGDEPPTPQLKKALLGI